MAAFDSLLKVNVQLLSRHTLILIDQIYQLQLIHILFFQSTLGKSATDNNSQAQQHSQPQQNYTLPEHILQGVESIL